jgi:hypothetical protein
MPVLGHGTHGWFLHGHPVAKTFQAFDQSSSRVFRLELVKGVSAGLVLRLPALDYVIGHHQNRMGDRQNSPLLAPACR